MRAGQRAWIRGRRLSVWGARREKAGGRRLRRRRRRGGEGVGRWCWVRVVMEKMVRRGEGRGEGVSVDVAWGGSSGGEEGEGLVSGGGEGRGSRWGFSIRACWSWEAREAREVGL